MDDAIHGMMRLILAFASQNTQNDEIGKYRHYYLFSKVKHLQIFSQLWRPLCQ